MSNLKSNAQHTQDAKAIFAQNWAQIDKTNLNVDEITE